MAKQEISSSWCSTKYDVFISFRGEDVRTNFVSHLRSALHRHNIKSYADDFDLQKGDELWPSLSKAIENSLLALVVFSKNYADSKWCLKELVKILKCRKRQGLVVIPVFYQVDPSHVRNYSGTYGEAMAKHETYFGDEHNEFIQAWKAALAEAANISGWDSRSPDSKDECQVIEKIVEDVTEKLSLRSPVELKVEELVQIETNCEEVKQLLSKKQKIGIWGMGGIGKTTIAKALFSQLFPQYDGVCFLANVSEESKRIGQISLCDKLLSELLKEGHHKYNFAGYEYNLKRLSNKKLLIVLDDVDCSDQLDGLCKLCNYAGPNSKVIITTRNRHLLSGRVNEIYEVKTWNFAESLELFSLHAFKERFPQKGYGDLSKKAVDYARGVPLALKVLGSNLYDRSTEFWDYELRKLMKCPNNRIQNVLQVSFDGLDDLQKKIFLDIAFFFKGENKDDVIRILDACGFYAASGIKVLEDKALITISYSGTIQMHDLIQEMGLNIVRGGSEDPGKRSRLSSIEEVCDVLENTKGSDLVEGIKLDLSLIEDLHLNVDTFNMMTNLRILRLHVSSGKRSGNVHHSGILSKLSGELRYLEWNGYPSKSLPVTFRAKMLVEIRMQHSHVTELWHGLQDVANLVRIDLSECKHLKRLPDLSMASKLKWVNLSGCESLCDIHPSVFSFGTIETLTLDGCKMLNSLKSEKHQTSLKYISVNGCTSLREFSVSSDSISSLDLSSTRVELLESSIGDLRNLVSLELPSLGHGNIRNGLSFPKYLEELKIHNCSVAIEKQKLHVLFGGLTFLRLLHLHNCYNLCELPDNISGLSNLYELFLNGSCVKTLPASIKLLENLETLSLNNCRNLESLPELPPNVTVLLALDCSSLGTISTLTSFAFMRGERKCISFQNCVRLDEPSRHCIMEGALLATISAMFLNRLLNANYGPNSYSQIIVSLPGRRVPGQFKYRTRDSSFTYNLPSSNSHFLGLTFCVVLSPCPGMKNIGFQIWCRCYFEDGSGLENAVTVFHFVATALISDHVFIWCCPFQFDRIIKIYGTGSSRRVSFEFSVTNGEGERVNIDITECGVCQVFYSQRDLVQGVSERVLGVEMESKHSATSHEKDCNDTNKHEWYLSQHCSSSVDCSLAIPHTSSVVPEFSTLDKEGLPQRDASKKKASNLADPPKVLKKYVVQCPQVTETMRELIPISTSAEPVALSFELALASQTAHVAEVNPPFTNVEMTSETEIEPTPTIPVSAPGPSTPIKQIMQTHGQFMTQLSSSSTDSKDTYSFQSMDHEVSTPVPLQAILPSSKIFVFNQIAEDDINSRIMHLSLSGDAAQEVGQADNRHSTSKEPSPSDQIQNQENQADSDVAPSSPPENNPHYSLALNNLNGMFDLENYDNAFKQLDDFLSGWNQPSSSKLYEVSVHPPDLKAKYEAARRNFLLLAFNQPIPSLLAQPHALETIREAAKDCLRYESLVTAKDKLFIDETLNIFDNIFSKSHQKEILQKTIDSIEVASLEDRTEIQKLKTEAAEVKESLVRDKASTATLQQRQGELEAKIAELQQELDLVKQQQHDLSSTQDLRRSELQVKLVRAQKLVSKLKPQMESKHLKLVECQGLEDELKLLSSQLQNRKTYFML